MEELLEPFKDYLEDRSSKSMNRVRWVLVILVWLIYIAAFPTLYNKLGPIALSFSGFPVFLTSWQAGLNGGLLSAVLITIINWGLMYWMGNHNWSSIIQSSFFGFILLLFGGAVVGRLHDLSRKLVRELKEKDQIAKKYQSIVESSIDGITLVNEEGKVIEWNYGQEQISGCKAADTLGRYIWDVNFDLQPDTLKVPSAKQQYRKNILEAIETGGGYWMDQLTEREIQQVDGSRFFIQIRKYPIKTDHGFMIGIFSRDITDRKKTEKLLLESEERFRATVSQSSDGILVSDENLNIIEWSSSLTEIFGYTREEMINKPVWQFQYDVKPAENRPPGFLEHVKERAMQIKEKGGYSQEEMVNDYEIQIKDGTRKIVQISSFPIKTSIGNLYGSIIRDISDQKIIERHLQHAATHDALTDLPNRILLKDRLLHSLANAARNKELLAVLYIDLDNFKNVNDSYGHATGDLLLQKFTERVLEQTRKCDTLARISGDEFIMILESISDPSQAANVAEKVIHLGNKPYHLNGNEFQTTLSIGISLYPTDGTDPALLLERADTAMYQAKQAGKNNLQFYSD